jgi:hypothetical protein
MDLGTAATNLPKELPAETGLATLFATLKNLNTKEQLHG